MADPTTAAQPGKGRAASYSCPQCTADMTFDAPSQALKCDHCGATVAVAEAAGRQAIVEYDLDQALASAASRGLGAEVRTTRCQECAATVSFADNLTSTSCEFCGSAQVLSQEQNRNLIRPQAVVPFVLDGKAARQSFARWVSRLWFRPSDLKRRARVGEMVGVYVPYWTFDSKVSSSWTAQAGYHYWETESYMDRDQKGNPVQKTRRVRRTRWEPAWGSRADAYDDVLICASRGLPEELARRLSTFDTGALHPYTPEFLAGWKAEEYAVDLNAAWHQAVDRMDGEQERRCASDVPGDTYRNLHVTSRFHDETFKHVLLPVWLAAFRYGGKVFRFLVNGQTGEVVGKAPWSIVKIVLLVLAILGLIAVGVLLTLVVPGMGGL